MASTTFLNQTFFLGVVKDKQKNGVPNGVPNQKVESLTKMHLEFLIQEWSP